MQLFNFQWLARPATRSLFLLFTYGSHRRLFINQMFFEHYVRHVRVKVHAKPGQSSRSDRRAYYQNR